MHSEMTYTPTPMQQGMLFNSLYEPGLGVDTIHFVFDMLEQVDVIKLQQAWRLITQRHELLRSAFRWEPDGSIQLAISDKVEPPFVTHDWQGLNQSDRTQRYEALLKTDRQQGYDFAVPPLLRIYCLRFAEQHTHLLLSMHHALIDGRSSVMLFHEAFELYEALRDNRPIPPPTDRLPFKHHADWLAQQDWEDAKPFWQSQMRGIDGPTIIDVEGIDVETSEQVITFNMEVVRLSAEFTTQLLTLAKQHAITLTTVIQGAWSLLLHHYSGAQDVVSATVRACRYSAYPDSATVMGPLINTIPLCAHVEPQLTLIAWLQQLRADWVAMRDYEHVPLLKIQEWSGLPRDTLLFESGVVIERARLVDALRQLNPAWNQRDLEPLIRPNFPLSLYAWQDEELQLTLTYDQSRYGGAIIAQLLTHLKQIITAIVHTPQLLISELPTQTPAEVALIKALNDTQRPFPSDRSVAQLFEAEVARDPDATALVFDGVALSYGATNARANQLAHRLIELIELSQENASNQSEPLIAIYLDRSFELLIAMLAIAKAGAAYVPLDTNAPPERISYMLNDTAASIIISNNALFEKLPQSSAQTLLLNSGWPATIGTPTGNPAPRSGAHNLAYVMYTSGSTGQPKGVCIINKNIARLVKNSGYMDFAPTERFMQFGATAFDASTMEIWGALLNGAALYIYPPVNVDLEMLATEIVDNKITSLVLPTGLFHQMVDYHLDSLRTLKFLMVGGDVLNVSHADRVRKALPNLTLINGYGPAENTVATTTFAVPPTGNLGRTLPIGKPVANTQVYILDAARRPVPLGVVGDLYTSGAGVGRGYWQRPELTAERFVDNPFGAGVMYATGDRARIRPNGNLDFFGRRDNQIKLRGFRIEMGEIEHALGQHPDIASYIVVMREDASNDKMLVAYLVAQPKATPATHGDMQTYLQRWLPSYMIPRHFVWLDEMPLTHNGKFDRRALPDPADLRPDLDDDFVAPRNPLEHQLATIWTEVLSLKTIGIYDDFFTLGGHSLLATQIISRMRSALEIDLPLRHLLEQRTIAGIATLLQADHDYAVASAPPLVAMTTTNSPLQLSFAQERLWFLAQLEPDNPFYNIALRFQIDGTLDPVIFEQALAELVRRHAALRTSFMEIDGQPQQIVSSDVTVAFAVVACDGDKLEGLISAETNRPFNLTGSSLLRSHIFTVNGQPRQLLVNMHHIISDGWSANVMLRELVSIYHAIAQGEAHTLPAMRLQYADYAAWQRAWLQDDALNQQLTYWQTALADSSGVLDLPTDYPRAPLQTYRGNTHRLSISSDLLAQLEALSQAHGATLFMTLTAAFNTLLWRYSGQDDIVIGTPIANRHHQGTEPLVGMFVNVLPLRTQLAGDLAFADLLAQTRQALFAAYAHQDVPLAELIDSLPIKRDFSRSPLYQVVLTLQNAAELSGLPLPEAQLIPQFNETKTAKFDITLNIEQRNGEWQTEWNYNSDLFAEETIARLAAHFTTLLKRVSDNPQQTLHAVSLLTSAEKTRHLKTWNATNRNYDFSQLVPDRIEAQVVATPNRVAVTFGDDSLTYAELNARANVVAHRLLTLGLQPNELVGVAVERSIEMLVGLLGVFKAGGAYVPLDPTHPTERVQYMIKSAEIAILVTQTSLQDRYDAQLKRILLDQLVPDATAQNPQRQLAPEDRAYVLFTSGSTGRPKGAQIPHRALLNMLLSMQKAPGFSAEDTIFALTTISFDISTVELFLPLMIGANIVIVSTDDARDGFALTKLIQQHGATVLQATPASWRMLLASGWQGAPNLTLISGGEAMTQDLARQLLNRGDRLWNIYGPTETTVYVTRHEVTDADLGDRFQSITIGKPMDNTSCYILDAQLEPVPVGVIGDLYIGGTQVGLGYLGQPELTAKSFIEMGWLGDDTPTLPFSQSPSLLVYKTGDLARYRVDGAIEFLGRSDFQVKIRGFRIELGEIEAALGQHDNIGAHKVVVHEQLSAEKELTAYFVAHQEPAPTVEALRRHLQQHLPDYMLPTHFVQLPEMPITPNGKIDRKALPLPTQTRSSATPYIAPRNQIEQQLSAIWSDVLQVDSIGVHDNFFDMGGHSLLATQVISRIRILAKTDLPLRQLFENPTVASLTQQLEFTSNIAAESEPALVAAERGATLPLSFAQERMWFLSQLEEHSPTYNVPLAFEINGSIDAALVEQTLAALVARHEVLRTTFTAIDGVPQQIIAPVGAVALREVDCAEDRLDGEISAEFYAPFNLATGPLFRTTILRVDGQPRTLLFNQHHIISDGWSQAILVREFSAVYAALSRHASALQTPLALQYADYAIWLRNLLSDRQLSAQLKHWQTHLNGYSGVLDLPTDFSRPPMQGYHGAAKSSNLSAELMLNLQTLSTANSATLYMTLFAAFNTLLWRYSGQDDIVIGSPIANRHREAVEPLLGLFVNTLALRTQLDAEHSFETLLAQVRETTLQGFAHQDAPLEKLLGLLPIERDPSRSPLFQVLFTLQNTPDLNCNLPNGSLRLLEGEANLQTATFDISLTLYAIGNQMRCVWNYNVALFAPETIERMARHYEELLTNIVAAPATPLAQLNYIPADERQLMLDTWNQGTTSYPSDATLPNLFAAQVARTPDTTAVEYRDQKLSYAEFDRRANQLAHHLIRLGVQPDQRVAMLLPRSLNLAVAMMAIWKAGAAYVPLAPEHPPERLSFMIDESEAVAVLTDAAVSGALPATSVPIIHLDSDWASQIAGYPSSAPQTTLSADNLAYVIYTSGSTGRPKGVMIEHHAAINLWAVMNEEIFADHVAPLRLGVNAPVIFDASVERWIQWLSGHTIVIVPQEVRTDAAQLVAFIREQRIDNLDFTPSQMRLMVAEGLLDNSPLKQAIVGGEATDDALWRQLTAQHDINFINAYGPTEATVNATMHPLALSPEKPVLGRPMPNGQLYIVDAALQPVAIGVIGELLIGGAGLARGYLGNKALTAEKFIANPFVDDPTARVYRSGDLARWLSDGTVEYMGRADHQVKLNGIRMEIGEIEYALGQHTAVEASVVLLREDVPGIKQLVAYLESAETAPTTVTEMRKFLQAWLPVYMIPQHFIWLDALPLTTNDKVDRKALPAPDVTRSELGQAYIAPRTQLEQQLADLWAEVLAQDEIGIDDNFFSLGGHSLLAIRLLAKVQSALNVKLRLIDFYQLPTVANLAQLIAADEQALDEKAIVPIDRSGTLPLSFAQQRLWFLDQYSPRGASYNVPSVLRISGDLNVVAIEQSLTQLVARHEILRTTYHLDGDAPSIKIAAPHPLPMPIVDVDNEETLEQHVLRDGNKSFDLQERVVRAQLLRLAADEHVLMINIHHIAMDFVSTEVIAHELAALYNAAVRGERPQLPMQAIQYVDYAAWQRDWLQGENWQRLLSYWQQELANAPATLTLPSDKPYPEELSTSGDTLILDIEGELVQQLRSICRQQSVTMYTLLLAVYQWQLHRYSNEAVIPVGTPYAGRDRESIASIIGFFVNTLVVATDVGAEADFAGLLKEVSERVLGGLDHAAMPFDKLLIAVDAKRSHRRTPTFQTFFAAQKSQADLIHFDGLRVRPLVRAGNSAKFELMLSVTDADDRLIVGFEYKTDLFSAETIQTMIAHYQILLNTVVRDLTVALDEPTLLLTQAERAQATAVEQRLAKLVSIDNFAIAPLRDAPQGAKLAAWVVGSVPPETAVGVQIIPVETLPLRKNGAVNFGRLPRPKAAPATPAKPKLSRAEQLAARRAKLAARRKNLSGDQQSKLAKLVEKASTPTEDDGIPKRDPDAAIPLSFAQERLWFLDQLTPESAAYNMAFRLTFHDPIDAALLSRSLTAMTKRHEILRTSFVLESGQPRQHVAAAQPIVITPIAVTTDEEIKRLSLADAHKPFDLSNGPLVRPTLLRHPEKMVLFLTIHHIICDGWSWSLFINELVQTYSALLAGQTEPVLPPLPAQYADFSAWQRQRVSDGDLKKQEAYWVEQLADAAELIDLPYDYKRSDTPDPVAGYHNFEVAPETVAVMRPLLESEGVSLYMLMTAVYGLLIQRYSGQDDFLIGTLLANRTIHTEKMQGFFTNTLPIRMKLGGNPTFRDYLQLVRKTILDSYANQDVPYERIVSAARPARDATHQPLLQALLVLQNTPAGDGGTLPIRMDSWGETSSAARFELLALCGEEDGRLLMEVEYNAELFSAETIEQMFAHYQTLLGTIALDTPIDEMRLLDSAETQTLLTEWNDTATDADLQLSLDSEVTRQAERTPNAIAVEHGTASISYAELEQQANQLAHFLRTQGIVDGSRVGLCLPRSINMTVALLAILKAGAAYVPLDPTYPDDRLAFMLSNANVALVLTTSELLTALPADRPQTVAVDLQRSAIATQPTSALNRPHHADNLVYIIYTSGSTGQPKGVMLPHRALVNLMHWQRGYFNATGARRALQFASLSFDVHCQEIFSTWWDGGTLVLVDDDVRRDASQLLQLLSDKHIERFFMPFVVLQQVAEVAEHRPDIRLALRDLISAGEQLQVTRQIRSLFDRLEDCVLHNHYGPSESHVVSALMLTGSAADWPHLPSIGKPISNTQMYVLDALGRPVPNGIAGDLFIGGVNVALGYVNRPKLTADRFISRDELGFKSDALASAGTRFYKTGDRARYRHDGTIDFLGRLDTQIKVRGYRIEMGEIEAVLSRHAGVVQAVVTAVKVAREGQLEEHQLVAHIVSNNGRDLSVELRQLIAEHLPDYMQPTQFSMLAELPRTPSGKIDRSQLAQLPMEQLQVNFTPPRTPLETALVQIWQRVLNLSPISVTSTFFELGGHSLLAVRLMTQVEQLLGRQLPLAMLFQHNSIEKLAHQLEQTDVTFVPSPLVTIRAQGDKAPLFCIHPGAGQILPYVELAREMDRNRPIYGLQSTGGDNSVEAMASSYINAIRSVQPDGPLHLFGWSMGGIIAYEMAQQLGTDQVAKLILLDSYAPSENSTAADAQMRLRFFAGDLGVNVNGAAALGHEAVFEQVRNERQLASSSVIAELYGTFERNYEAMVSYQPQPYAGEITLMLSAGSPDLGWEAVAVRPINRHVIPGEHFTFLHPPYLTSTAQKLEQLLT